MRARERERGVGGNERERESRNRCVQPSSSVITVGYPSHHKDVEPEERQTDTHQSLCFKISLKDTHHDTLITGTSRQIGFGLSARWGLFGHSHRLLRSACEYW